MKYVIALKHFQTNPHGDHMLNLAYHYGILYQEQHGDMLFFFREELADKRTAQFFGDLLCMQTEPMPIPPNLNHAFRSAFTMSCSPF